MIVAISILTLLLVVVTALPLVPVAHGLVRIGDFPRQQFLAIAAGTLLAAAIWGDWSTVWLVLMGALALVIAVQAWEIAEFTPLWPAQSAILDPSREDGARLRLVAANVKMSNDRFAETSRVLAGADADIVVLMEVDRRWIDGLDDLLASYPHKVLRPQDNSYGMVLASRLPLHDVKVECLLTDGIPSIVATVEAAGGPTFRLYCIHPEPPVPHRGTEGRDGETSLVALKVREEDEPVIVTGDLNDVAWSRTTRRFRRISGLLDPRVGRRVFSTFDARLPFLRWPLDHLFHSAEFRLVGMRRLPPCGSDHFPVRFDLALCSEPRAGAGQETADRSDIERAEELVERAEVRDSTPIGTDWEKPA